jgi:hypothetical protein
MKNTLLDKIARWLGRCQFFTYSALLHIVLIVTFGGVAWTTIEITDDGFELMKGPRSEIITQERERTNEPLPTDQRREREAPKPVWEGQAPITPNKRLDDIITTPRPTGPEDFVVGGPMVSPRPGGVPAAPPNLPETLTERAPLEGKPMTRAMAENIRRSVKVWKGGQTGQGGRYEFQAYVARYAGGDWYSAHELSDGKIIKGAMVNLAYLMREWSGDKVKVTANPQPLDLAGPDLMNERPPFIYFTGSQSFQLTEEEVTNLRRYLLVGGAVWGDSSLPGRNSRFDLAFRQEMKRVVGDISVQWEKLPADHALTRSDKRLDAVPAGLNYYDEAVYVMRPVAGEISILYTANDYGNMMEIGLNEDGEIDFRRDARGRYVAIDPELWHNRGIYFRNLNEESVRQAFEFSNNMVMYLLIRWEDHLRRFNR